MKKSTKRIVVAVVSTIVLIVAILGVFAFRAALATNEMSPAETGQVAPNVFAVRDGFVNLYLMDSGDGYVAFDAGRSPDVVLEEMASLSIQPERALVRPVTPCKSLVDNDHSGALITAVFR